MDHKFSEAELEELLDWYDEYRMDIPDVLDHLRCISIAYEDHRNYCDLAVKKIQLIHDLLELTYDGHMDSDTYAGLLVEIQCDIKHSKTVRDWYPEMKPGAKV